ncbi:MAG: DUF2007 domain-containing protein [Alphaproteobacteria bacterium]|nr:DUF2007 domain-containing protein [Alphaproteobacteria bacterium]
MKELLRTNDPVRLSFIGSVLRDSGIESVVFDEHTSVLEGSIGILPRRLMVLDEDYDAARRLLRETGQEDE